MSCSEEKYISLMNKVLDEEASMEEEHFLYEHLAFCDSCRNHFNELKQSTELLNQLVHPQLPVSFTKSVLDQLPPENRHVIRKWTTRHPVLAAMAVCAVPMSLAAIAAGRQSRSKRETFALVKVSGDRA